MAEDSRNSKFFISTPIYYVSGRPHIGTAYTTIAADVLARYHRLKDEEVLFVTGTDEHGQKVVKGAADAGKSPKDYTDGLVAEYKKAWERLHITYDRFIRTTEEEHVAVVQRVFEKLLASGDIYKSEYTGWYCVPCETYFLEGDLVDGNCPDCGRPVEQVAQEAYFFATSKYADALIRYIEEHEEFIGPDSRRNEVLAFIRGGLNDACVSRNRTDWDIPVPGDQDHCIYVWFDALINYLTVAGYTLDDGKFTTLWPPDVQLMGKDILTRFHATIWPAMLMALDIELPTRLFAHGWWSDEAGQKISKSRHNVIDPFEVIGQLVEYSGARTQFVVDTLRYYVLRDIPFGHDGNFAMRGLLNRFNADLANDLGNLLNRTLPLIQRYVDGRVPEAGPASGALSQEVTAMTTAVNTCLEEVDFRGALIAIWEFIARCNKFIDEREPWALYKQGKRVELDAVLYDLLDSIRIIAIMISPVMPEVADEIWEQLGLAGAGVQRRWEDLRTGALPAKIEISRGAPIFPRIDIDRVLSDEEVSMPAKAQAKVSPAKDAKGSEDAKMVPFKEFMKLDLRTGRIVEATRIPDTDKLLVMKVDIGEDEPRQIVAGLAEVFNPRELIGRSVVVVANLEPAKICGTESNGMILAAGEEKPLALLTTDADVEPGEKVR